MEPQLNTSEPAPLELGETGIEERAGTYAELGEKLPMSIKLAYGMPNLAGAGMAIPIGVHMNLFYSDVVLVPLGFIALAVALARSFDAFTDPLMGWLTDRTRTRWGRRMPWMFVGAPLCAVAFVLLFSPPAGLSGQSATLWFTSTFILYFLFHTMYVIPHYGLGPELTQDYHERSSLFAVMEGFAVFGTLCGTVIPFVFFGLFGGQRPGFTAFAVSFGLILTGLYFWQCYRIKERPDFYGRKPNPLVPGVRRVARNRPAVILFATYFVGSVTGAIPGLMMPFFTKYVLAPENDQLWLMIYLATYFGSGLITLPLWLRATRRFGKYAIYIVTALVGVSASTSLFFMGEGDMWPTFVILAWAGSAFGVRLFLGPSIQGDVIDYDELYSGRRREAQYGALWAILVKFTVIPSAAIPLAIMAQLGYAPNVEQNEQVRFAISAIFGLAPATFGLLSLVVFLAFPIREHLHNEILAGIQKHKRGEAALDPVTGVLVPPPSDRGVDEETGWFLDHFSPRELSRWLRRGGSVLERHALAWSVGALSLSTSSFWLVSQSLGDLSQKPGLATTAEVVVGGLSFTACIYHLIRYRAARRLRAQPIAHDVVRAHLEVTRVFAQNAKT